jgi:hypothetical protein
MTAASRGLDGRARPLDRWHDAGRRSLAGDLAHVIDASLDAALGKEDGRPAEMLHGVLGDVIAVLKSELGEHDYVPPGWVS